MAVIRLSLLFAIVFSCPFRGECLKNPHQVKMVRTNAVDRRNPFPRTEPPTTEDYVEYYRYPFKTYNVTTADGYILELHRIPYGTKKNAGNSRRRIPVVLAHGIFHDSSSFVIAGENSPAFMFSDAGYDVWMLNYRGNRYSRLHVNLVPETDFEYWEFSFNEIGIYDLPASIEYILSVSGQRQLFLLGYSMGGAAVTIFLSENPKYNENVVAMYLMAPAISMPPETHELAYQFRFIEKIFLAVLENMQVLPFSAKLFQACQIVCFGPLITVCKQFLEYISEINTSEMTSEAVVSEVMDLLSHVTVKLSSHLMQMVASSRFAKFDYGTANMEIYNQTEPPEYNIEGISVPVTIFCGLQDTFINCTDMLATCNRFRNLVRMVSVPFVRHADFVRGHQAKRYVYDVIIQDMVLLEDSSSDPMGHSKGNERLLQDGGDSKTIILSSVLVASDMRHNLNPFMAVAIAILVMFTVILSALSIRSRFREKSAKEHVSLVAYKLRPPSYDGNR